MSDNTSILGEIIEQGKTVVKQTGKQVAKLPSDLAKTAGSQVTGLDAQKSKEETREFVKSIYETSESKPITKQEQKANQPPKKLEDEEKIQKLRRELHAKYYQNLVNPPKPKEERQAEKVEREKKQEMVDLQEKEKKKPPILVQRAAQRVEKYPGASG